LLTLKIFIRNQPNRKPKYRNTEISNAIMTSGNGNTPFFRPMEWLKRKELGDWDSEWHSGERCHCKNIEIQRCSHATIDKIVWSGMASAPPTNPFPTFRLYESMKGRFLLASWLKYIHLLVVGFVPPNPTELIGRLIRHGNESQEHRRARYCTHSHLVCHRVDTDYV